MSVRRLGIVLLTSTAAVAALAPAASANSGYGLRVSPQTIVAPDRAGYAVTPAKVQRVAATWTQPSADCSAKTTYSTFDVSIDGSRRPFRVGTALECHGGRAVSYAFIGGPRGRMAEGDVVRPGDRMRASIEVHRTFFSYSIENVTERWGVGGGTGSSSPLHFSTVAVLARARTSAAGQVLPVTRFDQVAFQLCRVNGHPMGLEQLRRIVMHTPSGGLARPSGVTNESRFKVSRPGE